ncbi:MAG: ERF family protein [Pseudomonadota bacterium]
MEKSESITKLASDLVKMAANLKPVAFDSENPFFKSRYSSLASVMESVRPALAQNNLAIVQATIIDNEPQLRVSVETWLIHSSGEWLKSTISLKPLQDNPQAIGSTISYGRRYGVSALLGVTSEFEDNDAEIAMNRGSEKPASTKRAAETAKKTPIADSQKNNDTLLIQDLAKRLKLNGDLQKELQTISGENISTVDQLSVEGRKKVVEEFQKRLLPPTIGNERIAKIREIFQRSAALGHTPDQMKSAIGQLIGLNRPIKESAEIKDNQLDIVLAAFRDEAANNQNQGAVS